MLQLLGKIVNVAKDNDSIDRETGEKRTGKFKVQIMGANPLESGEQKLVLIDVSTEYPAPFKPFLNKTVVLPVRASAFANNVYFSCPAGFVPTEAKGQAQGA
jgi:hypothetical protein